LSLLAPVAASAAPVDVPLSSLVNKPPPQNGALSNGVGWSVALNPGPSSIAYGWLDYSDPSSAPFAVGSDPAWPAYYVWYPRDGNQVWNFSTPVNLSFTITDLQGGSNIGRQEGVVLPAGAMCDLSGVDPAEFSYIVDPITKIGTLAHIGPHALATPGVFYIGSVLIPCTLNNVTTLTLDGTGFDLNMQRGLHSLTAAPATLQAQFSGLPSLIKPGETVQGKLTCSNAGPGPDALNVTCDPVIASGGGSISNVQCTPPSPVGTLHDGQSIVCTFDLTAPNTSTVNMQLTGTTTADGLFATTATRSPGGMTATLWLSSIAAAVPTLNEWALVLLGLAMLGVAGVGFKRRV